MERKTAVVPAGQAAVSPADQVPDLDEGRRGYVAGFLLDQADRVVLVRKLRPAWQAGLLNGVGGKIEAGETPAEAMRREFREEAGLDLDGWEHFASVTFPAGTVWFFRLFADSAALDRAQPCTDEPIETWTISDLLGPDAATIPNLRWLLPLAAYRQDRYAPVSAHEVHASE